MTHAWSAWPPRHHVDDGRHAAQSHLHPYPDLISGHDAPPHAGQLQADVDGQVWRCDSVIAGAGPAGHYVVRLSRLHGSDPVGEPLTLAAPEYASFSHFKRLRPVLI